MAYEIWAYTIASVILVSLLSLLGIFTLYIRGYALKRFLIYTVSFSAGALIGDAFIHLLPEAVKETGFSFAIAIYVISGIAASFLLEKVIRWRHSCGHHHSIDGKHSHIGHHEPVKPFAIMNLFGDGVHNLIDGIIIGASYVASIPIGIATTIAVILHEIPQEIGDFGVLLHGGFSVKRALMFNFLTATTAIIGAAVTLLISSYVDNLTLFLLPFSAGTFIYIAGSDLIPEIQKTVAFKKSAVQFLVFLAGIATMALLLLLEL